MGRNVPVQKREGAKRPGPKMSGGETSWSKMLGGETSRSKMSGAKRPGPKCQGLNVQVQNVRGETSCPKRQGAKRLGPKRLSPKSPGAKTLPEHSLHDYETSSMIVTFPELLYDCEVLLLSFKFELCLVNWFDLIREIHVSHV